MGLGRRILRRLASLPLEVIDADVRAEAIDNMARASTAIADVPGAKLKFYAPSPLLRTRARSVLNKEPDTIAWLNTLSADAVLWDVGANVGVFSLYAAAVRGCHVLAFEPSAANFFVLTRNIQLNELSRRATAYCVALSGASGLGTLNLDSPALGAAMSQFGSAGDASRYAIGGDSSTHGMLGLTIDDFIRWFAPPFPTHIKLDVDGLEWPILQGAAATLRDWRLQSIMVELSLTHDDERQRATQFLTECGLQFISRGDSQGQAGEHAANHLFRRR
jgi:FkbM family methyltransferase